MYIHGIYQKHFIGCYTCSNLTSGIIQQCFVVLRFWLTLGRSLHYFFVLLLLTLSIVNLFIVNVIKCYLTPNMLYIYGSCCKTLVCKCATPSWVFFTDIFCNLIGCYDEVLFNFYYFIAVLIGKTCSMSLIRFDNHIFFILFISLLL